MATIKNRLEANDEGLTQTRALFPQLIDGEVFYCGFNSPLSFGASSYFVRRPEGNVLVDSPRFEPELIEKFQSMGGIEYIFLTHKDDVAEHSAFAAHFKAKRILSGWDQRRGLEDVEILIDGQDPVKLADDLLIIPVPGHTKGSMCLLHKGFLFTGDHLAQNPGHSHPTAFNNHCWYSWSEQIASMKRLAEYDFEWILPGHSGSAHYTLPEMKQKMAQCISWMESVTVR
ncbi:MAG: MBL fold metallo-hydrolase [Nitrospinae bacterium]|nr:MBL fold metallo-hydrolase [Nitrospinota bacterium]